MIYTHALAAVLALALGFGSGWKVRAWKADSDDTARIQAEQIERDRAAIQADAAAEGNATRTAAIRTQIRTVTREVERVVEKPVYRAVCLDADGLQLVARAAGAASAADPGQPAPAVPASGAAP